MKLVNNVLKKYHYKIFVFQFIFAISYAMIVNVKLISKSYYTGTYKMCKTN